MKGFKRFALPELSMKRKLFGYMFTLTAILLILLIAGLYLFDRFDSTQKSTYDSLDIQMEVFEKEILAHWDRLAASGIHLSEDAAAIIDSFLAEERLSFAGLNDSAKHLEQLQGRLAVQLRQEMLKEQCSGVFIMLDATINSSVENAARSRSGVYLQVNGYGSTDSSVLMYRGSANVAKANDFMLHRKWHLEFNIEEFPNYDTITALRALPTDEAYFLTDAFRLSNTSDRAMLMVVPVCGSDGTYFGICGFEIRDSFFMSHHAQPTKIERLCCVMSPQHDDGINAAEGFTTGVLDGYYMPVSGMLELRKFGGGLRLLEGDNERFVGISHSVKITPNNDPYVLTVMMPKADYDREYSRGIVQNTVLWTLLIVLALNCCLFFSRRFLKPILRDLEAIKSEKREEISSSVTEINDLVAYLAEQDRQNEITQSMLEKSMLHAREETRRLYDEYSDTKAAFEQAEARYRAAEAELDRLARAGKAAVDPEEYQIFLEGLETLTPTERKIYNYYLNGKTVKEIVEISQIKESTLRFHNKNIYSKLGVHSLKQLLQYAAMSDETASYAPNT